METDGSLQHLQEPAISLILSHFIPVHAPIPLFKRSTLILSFHLRLGLPSGLFHSGFPTKSLYAPLLFPVSSTCSVYLILLDFITRIMFGEE